MATSSLVRQIERRAKRKVLMNSDSEEDKVSLSLRIWHPTLSVDEINSGLGLKLKYFQSIGAGKITITGRVVEGVYEKSYLWAILEEKCASRLDHVVENWCTSLELLKSRLVHIVESGGEMTLSVTIVSNDMYDFYLPKSLLDRVSSLGLGLEFSLYAGDKAMDQPP